MSIPAIEMIPLSGIDGARSVESLSSLNHGSFMEAIGEGLQGLNGDLSKADGLARAMAAGDIVPVHDVMIAMEQAHLELQMAVEVRNRIVDAYQNLTNMQL